MVVIVMLLYIQKVNFVGTAHVCFKQYIPEGIILKIFSHQMTKF